MVDDYDFDNDGVYERWGVSLKTRNALELCLYRDPTEPGTFASYTRSVVAEAGSPQTFNTGNSWGAGWVYQNTVYFAHNVDDSVRGASGRFRMGSYSVGYMGFGLYSRQV